MLCSGGAGEPQVGELVRRLGCELPGILVLELRGACERHGAIAEALSELEVQRVVLACERTSVRRGELLAALRDAGVGVSGSYVVDLHPAKDADGGVVVAQSAVLVRAAVARVAAADPEEPVRERTSLAARGISRRSLLRGFGLARRPVASWRPGRCEGAVACTACLLSCPYGALSTVAGRVVVDEDSCTGCGACVRTCRGGGLCLAGASLQSLQAATEVLVASLARGTPASGIAITCERSVAGPPVGGQWLALGVPSLEMVSAGWLLQLVAAGTGVRLVACDEDGCRRRAGDLERFADDVLGKLGLAGQAPRPSAHSRIELREPEATTQALSALGAFEPGRADWLATGPACPLGSLEVAAGCSFCEVCVVACPTGALVAERDISGTPRLSLDPRRCCACGACVEVCPEKVVSLQRAAGGVLVTEGTRLLAVGTEPRRACESCGAALLARLPAPALARAGGSHPHLAPEARAICPDCRLQKR